MRSSVLLGHAELAPHLCYQSFSSRAPFREAFTQKRRRQGFGLGFGFRLRPRQASFVKYTALYYIRVILFESSKMAVPFNANIDDRYRGIYRKETTYFPQPLDGRRRPPPYEVKLELFA